MTKTILIIFFLLISFLFNNSCNENNQKVSQENSSESKNIESQKKKISKKEYKSDFKYVHTFRSNSKELGKVYANYFNKDIFDTLYIINTINNYSDTLYSIEHDKFKNKNGIDINVYPDDFWGYSIVLKKNSYIILSYFRNKGKNISDDITIQWNKKEKIFQVLKTP